MNDLRHPGMHPCPKPRGTEVEAVRGRLAAGIHGQDAATEAFACFQKLEIDSRLLQTSRRVQARKASPNDCHGRSHCKLPYSPIVPPLIDEE